MIKFGTDGWRAIIANDFNYQNLEKVSVAIAKFILSDERKNLDIYNIDYNKHKEASYKVEYRDYTKAVAIGYDFRFMSENFAEKVAEVLSSFNIPVFLSSKACSTPALSLEVFNNYSAGIMITASHNPYTYNGLKYKAEYGGSSTVEMTKLIEKFLENQEKLEIKPNLSLINRSKDFQKDHLEILSKKVDIEKVKNYIEKNDIYVVIDYMNGVLINSFKSLINSRNIIELNNERNPYFNGGAPEPIPQNLKNLKKIINLLGSKAIGFAFDGDGDRIFAINNQDWISPHEILPLLTLHLVKNKKWNGKVVRTISTSTKLKRLAEKIGVEAIETNVGFKFIADLFVKDNILIGGEESGGIGFKNHIPERDSLLNALYIIEMLADLNLKPIEILNYLHNIIGESYCHRYDWHLASFEQQKETYERIKKEKEKINSIFIDAQIIIEDYIKIAKSDFEWIVLRPSGTEPLIRIYSESYNLKQAQENIEKIKNLFNN